MKRFDRLGDALIGGQRFRAGHAARRNDAGVIVEIDFIPFFVRPDHDIVIAEGFQRVHCRNRIDIDAGAAQIRYHQ